MPLELNSASDVEDLPMAYSGLEPPMDSATLVDTLPDVAIPGYTDLVSKDCDDPVRSVSVQSTLLTGKETTPTVEYCEEWTGCKDLWDAFDISCQPDDAPNGAFQMCYWTDGMYICRFKMKNIWHYSHCKKYPLGCN